ncbi:hypothetical protein JTE90_018678 [Oedothorax gibbosus]|uniref:Uncharacterized protein n=2 Tax=Oedothorax gibbosus TaxID=931172 RepID=A0AAV6UZK3_9ARAC|nr:hypothetical protein JTE90_018678 [Oedothorax gibbosus]
MCTTWCFRIGETIGQIGGLDLDKGGVESGQREEDDLSGQEKLLPETKINKMVMQGEKRTTKSERDDEIREENREPHHRSIVQDLVPSKRHWRAQTRHRRGSADRPVPEPHHRSNVQDLVPLRRYRRAQARHHRGSADSPVPEPHHRSNVQDLVPSRRRWKSQTQHWRSVRSLPTTHKEPRTGQIL